MLTLAPKRSYSLTNLWRRGWDSNPRTLSGQRFSRPPDSATLAPLRKCLRVWLCSGQWLFFPELLEKFLQDIPARFLLDTVTDVDLVIQA